MDVCNFLKSPRGFSYVLIVTTKETNNPQVSGMSQRGWETVSDRADIPDGTKIKKGTDF